MNISLKSTPKTMMCLISFLCLLSFSSTSTQNHQLNFLQQSRNLQYSLGSIYYELAYPINNLTGTGDRLKDVPYKVQCKIKQCDSGCCVGEIDSMVCGLASDCAVYLEKSREPSLIIGIVVPFSLLIIFLILFIIFRKGYNVPTGKSMLYALLCLTIVLIPFIAYWIYKNKENVTTSKKQREG